MQGRVAGFIKLIVNGELVSTKGSYRWNLGQPLRQPVLGSDGSVFYREEPQEPMIEGKITLLQGTDVDALVTQDGVQVQLEIGNGDVVGLREAWFSGSGVGDTQEQEFEVKWTGKSGFYVRAAA